MTVIGPGARARLIIASAMSVLAATLYIPAMPDLAADLGEPLPRVQASLSLFLFALALGMPLAGPLSDQIGRRVPLLGGFLLYVAGSLVCALTGDLVVLYAGRLLQAAGACLALTVARAIVRDITTGSETARMMASIGMVVAVVPSVAPLIGAHLNTAFGWRAAFLVLAAIAGLTWLGSLRMRETRPERTAAYGVWATILRDLRALVVDRRYVGTFLVLIAVGGGFYCFFAAAPAVLLGRMGVDNTTYGIASGVHPACFVLGNFLVSRLSGKVRMTTLLRVGASMLALAGLLGLTLNSLFTPTPLTYVLPMVLFGGGNGLIVANAFALALAKHGARAATAGGFANLAQLGGGALGTLTVALLPEQTPITVHMAVLGFGLIGTLSFWLIVRQTLEKEA